MAPDMPQLKDTPCLSRQLQEAWEVGDGKPFFGSGPAEPPCPPPGLFNPLQAGLAQAASQPDSLAGGLCVCSIQQMAQGHLRNHSAAGWVD